MFIDGHNDTLWAMHKQQRKFSERSEKGHIDLPRAQEAGLLAGFFTGYPTESFYVTEKMLRDWTIMVNNPENKLDKITSLQQLDDLYAKRKAESDVTQHKIGAILHLEGAAGIDSELNRLYLYYEMGLRSMGITWNEQNQFATGQAQGEERGFTREGLDLLSAMQDLGIIIDVAHLNDKCFWEVINNTNVPIIASHSNARELANSKRNLTNEMIQAIHDTGGVIGINLYTAFLSNEPETASMTDIVKMYGKMIEIGGPKLVMSGTDLDGANLPSDIKDVTSLPLIFSAVQEAYSLSANDIESILINNIRRVMQKIWK